MEEQNDLWKNAEILTQNIEENKIELTPDQEERLNELIQTYNSYLKADLELKKSMIGILFERQVYMSKIWLLEKIGVKNKWDHPLLEIIQKIIYQENEDFSLIDKAKIE